VDIAARHWLARRIRRRLFIGWLLWLSRLSRHSAASE
jgi:hypothetical protein